MLGGDGGWKGERKHKEKVVQVMEQQTFFYILHINKGSSFHWKECYSVSVFISLPLWAENEKLQLLNILQLKLNLPPEKNVTMNPYFLLHP